MLFSPATFNGNQATSVVNLATNRYVFDVTQIFRASRWKRSQYRRNPGAKKLLAKKCHIFPKLLTYITIFAFHFEARYHAMDVYMKI